MKKRTLWLCLVALSACAALAGVWVVRQKTRALAGEQAARLQAMERDAAVSAERARLLAAAGTADLKVQLSKAFLTSVLEQLSGFSSTTRRGNHIHVREAHATFHDGFIRLDVRAEVALKLFKGPVRATYYVFAGLTEDGRCRLDLQVAHAVPTDPHLVPAQWLEPWLVRRLQDKLKFPNIELPLGFERRLDLPQIDKTIETNGLQITIPARRLNLAAHEPAVWVHPDGLLLLAADHELPEPQAGGETDGPSPEAPAGDLTVSVRFSLLAKMVAELLQPPRDILLHADYMPDVWQQDKKILGIKVHNHADIRAFDGYLDITRAGLRPTSDGMMMDLAAEGFASGMLEGKAYGIRLDRPFDVQPVFSQTVPVGLTSREDDLYISWPPTELVVRLDIQTTLGSRAVSFHHDLRLQTEDVLRPISLPHWFRKTVDVPIRVNGRTIEEVRRLPLHLDWRMSLPEDVDGYVQFAGDVALDPVSGSSGP